MITKNDEITMIWETNKIEQIRDLKNITEDLYVNLIFEQIYSASFKIAQDWKKLSQEQQNFLKEQLASTLLLDKEVIEESSDLEYISTSDVSKILGISPQAVRKWCESGKLVATRTFGDYGEWKIDTAQFKRDKEMKVKYNKVISEKKKKQLRTHQALKNLSNLPNFTYED